MTTPVRPTRGQADNMAGHKRPLSTIGSPCAFLILARSDNSAPTKGRRYECRRDPTSPTRAQKQKRRRNGFTKGRSPDTPCKAPAPISRELPHGHFSFAATAGPRPIFTKWGIPLTQVTTRCSGWLCHEITLGIRGSLRTGSRRNTSITTWTSLRSDSTVASLRAAASSSTASRS